MDIPELDFFPWISITDGAASTMEDDETAKFLLEKEAVFRQYNGVLLVNSGIVGSLKVTNFRLLFVSEKLNIVELGTIPLTTIEKVIEDVKISSLPRQDNAKAAYIQVVGKDIRIITYSFRPYQKSQVLEDLQRFTRFSQLGDIYAFICGRSTQNRFDPKLRLMKEYHRLFRAGFPPLPSSSSKVELLALSNKWWRTTSVNSNYHLCSSYPSMLIVPKFISDDDLTKASAFRAGQRLPVISWFHSETGAAIARSSQPFVGLWSRNEKDEKLVGALCTPASGSSEPRRKLYIVDARPRANAMGNQAKGGGTEPSANYFKSEVLFLGIQNIHAMRDSITRLREYVDSYGTSSSDGTTPHWRNRGSPWSGGKQSSISFASLLGEGGWLNHVNSILVGASWIASCVAEESASVLVHCSDGWDRTAQLVALACLLLDPYYRTFDGFQALIEKDWLAFGHPFSERMGIPNLDGGSQVELYRQNSTGNFTGSLTGSPVRTFSMSSLPSVPNTPTQSQVQSQNNSSPVMLQWLDCVSQLLRLYPNAFEFSTKFLVDLMDCVLSCRFGNFLCNSEKEREKHGVADACNCVWVHLAELRGTHDGFHEHCNPFYDSEKHNGPLLPPPPLVSPIIWPQFHLRWACSSESDICDLDVQWRAMAGENDKMKKAVTNAEFKVRKLQEENNAIRGELQSEKERSEAAIAHVNATRRENAAMQRAVESLGCSVKLLNGKAADGASRRRETGDGHEGNIDISISISSTEVSMVADPPASRVCKSFCPLRTREGCKWPDAGCALDSSQFVGLKANFDAFDRMSIEDHYF